MFMQKIIKMIWADHYTQVDDLIRKYEGLSEEMLLDMALKECQKLNIKYFSRPGFIQNIIPSIGCTKCFKQYPCSFCSFHLENEKYSALMRILRRKNVDYYVKVLLENFKIVRGAYKVDPYPVELFAVRDFFNKFEFPEQAFTTFLGEDGVFTRKPLYGTVFTGGIVQKEEIQKLRTAFKKNVSIMMGIEIKSEWIRKYWLNKNVTNENIEKSIYNISEIGATCGATVILGMPGLTDKQSIDLLIDTIKWLDSMPVTYIQIGYLVIKPNTIQEYIYNNLKDDQDLNEIGVVKGLRTGLIDIIVLYDTIARIFLINRNIYKKIIFSTQNFIDNGNKYRNLKRYGKLSSLEEQLLDEILNITRLGMKNVEKFLEKYDYIKDIPEYSSAMENFNKQKGISYLSDTFEIVGKKLLNKINCENKEILLQELHDDIDSYIGD